MVLYDRGDLPEVLQRIVAPTITAAGLKEGSKRVHNVIQSRVMLRVDRNREEKQRVEFDR